MARMFLLSVADFITNTTPFKIIFVLSQGGNI